MIHVILAAVQYSLPRRAPPLALIVPHTGTRTRLWRPGLVTHRRLRRGSITRVVVAGPAHRVPVRGLALSSADGFATSARRGPAGSDGDPDAPRAAPARIPRRSGTRGGAQHRGARAVPATKLWRPPACRWSRSWPATLRRRWWPRTTISGPTRDTDRDLQRSQPLPRCTNGTATGRADGDGDRRCRVRCWRATTPAASGPPACRVGHWPSPTHGEHVELLDLRNWLQPGPADRVVGYGSFVVR